MAAQVREMHKRVRGRIREPAGAFPAGTPYSADIGFAVLWCVGIAAGFALVSTTRYRRTVAR